MKFTGCFNICRLAVICISFVILMNCGDNMPDQQNDGLKPFLNDNKYLRNISARKDIPVIAMLTIPCERGSEENYCFKSTDRSFLPATYPKWLAAAGAQILPLMYSESDEFFERMLPQVNGIFLTGGHYNEQYRTKVAKIVHWVLKQNRDGNKIPLWGTCLGFQFIALSIMEDINNNFQDRRIKIKPYIQHLSKPDIVAGRIFDEQRFPGSLKIMEKLRTLPLAYHQHHYGIAKSDFKNNENLSSILEPLASNIDASGNEYVSIFQGREFPIYGVQFHPEKTGFEPLIQDIHTLDHHLVSQHFAQFFVDEARRHSTKQAPSDQIASNLLQNFTFQFHKGPFSEIYVFTK